MTISFPLTIPNHHFKRLTVRAHQGVGQARSQFTYQTQVYKHQAELWVWEVTLPVLPREDAEAWTSFLLKLQGPYGTFMMGDPSAFTPRGTATGTPRVNGGTQSGRSLITDGWTPSVTNILKAGDFIQIGNQLYKVLSDVNSDGSGNATLDLFPILRQIYADNALITVSNCKGEFRLMNVDVPIYNVSEDKNYEIAFSAIEAMNT